MKLNTVFHAVVMLTIVQPLQGAILYKSYALNDEQKQKFLDEHNRLRALEPAANMQRLVWDENLADLARRHAATCNAWHRPANQRVGYGFSYIGENIWWSTEWWLRENLETIVQMWYNQKPFWNFYSLTCAQGQQCGHYTAVTWATSCALGCGVSYCDGILNGRGITRGHIVVCNYGPGGNWPGQHTYIVGQKCTRCPNGRCDGDLCETQCSAGQQPVATTTAAPEPAVKPKPPPPKKPQPEVKIVEDQTDADDCRDYHQDCNYWQRIGECARNPRYMLNQCKQSCAACDSSGQSATTWAPPPQPRTRVCVDNHMHCPFWTTTGECNNNPGYMRQHCAASCNYDGQCTQLQTTASFQCGDFDQSCAYWASIGECWKNAYYMQWRCRRACNLC